MTPRRSLPRALLGAGLVVGCALAFAVAASAMNQGRQVLALARDVQAGQPLRAADLKVVEVTGAGGAGGVALVPQEQKAQWIGRALTGPLPAGQLLTPANLGPAAWPPSGTGVVAVPVKPGRLPSGLAAGARVRVVLPVAGSPAVPAVSGSGTSDAAEGTVVRVQTEATSGTAATSVVSLLMSAGEATRVAAAGDDVVVVLTGPPASGGVTAGAGS